MCDGSVRFLKAGMPTVPMLISLVSINEGDINTDDSY